MEQQSKPNVRETTMRIATMPKTVYRADDGVHPQWRFHVVAANTSEETVRLEKVTMTLHSGDGSTQRVQSGEEIQGIVQGSREVRRDEAVVLMVEDLPSHGTAPDSVTVDLCLAGHGGEESIAAADVPLVFRPTLYLHFPLVGRWLAANARTEQHCVGVQFGFDLIAEQDVPLHDDPPERAMTLEEFASFGRPLLVPVDGVVAECVDDQRDFPPTPGKVPFPDGPPKEYRGRVCGNYVLIQTGKNDCVVMGHLRQGSLRVKVGDRVRAGQEIAQVGNSGNSTGPHLHIEVLDGVPDLTKLGTLDFAQSGVPFGFRQVALAREGETIRETEVVPRRMDIVRAVA